MVRYVLPLLFEYDSTVDESDTTEAHGVGVKVQIAKNLHAVRAARALSRISGIARESQTPYNQEAADALKALLTPKLASMLKYELPKDLLIKLNSNMELPEVKSLILIRNLKTQKHNWMGVCEHVLC